MLLLFSHSKVHSSEIRNEPDYPDKQAVFVKTDFWFFGSLFYHKCSPNCVNQHKPKCNLSCKSMRFKNIKRFWSNLMHKPRTVYIKEKTNPKTYYVPFFKIMRISFRPNPKRVKNKCKSYQNSWKNNFYWQNNYFWILTANYSIIL